MLLASRGRAIFVTALLFAVAVAGLGPGSASADHGTKSSTSPEAVGAFDRERTFDLGGTDLGLATDVTASLDGRDVTYHRVSARDAPEAAAASPTGGVPVYRPLDRPDDPALHRFGTGQLLLRHTGFPDAAALEILAIRYTGLENLWLARIDDPFLAVDEARRLAQEPGVLHVEPVLQQLVAPDFIATDPLFADQWHLDNTGQSGGTAGIDIGWVAASDLSTGAGAHVNIIDDGLYHAHPDFDAARYAAASSDDHCAGDSDPTPTSGDFHGTAVGGLIAASGSAPATPEGPGIGGVGVAPDVTFSGQRLIACGVSSSDVAAAFTLTPDDVDIYSNSWGFTPGASGTHTLSSAVAAAYSSARDTGRGGLGNLIVWSAGNGRDSGDSGEYDEHKTQRSVLSVAAIGNDGQAADYSEGCACLVIAAPSSGGTIGQTTTDIPGADGYDSTDYTCQDGPGTCFGGTSGAAPVAAGVMALMLAANPALTWRDVLYILADTADSAAVEAASPHTFATNGAGHAFHHLYGFGLIDAEAAVTSALGWTNLGPEVSTSLTFTGPPESVADGTGSFPTPGAVTTIDLGLPMDEITIENAVLEIDATHTYENDLEVVLVSPCGTRSTILSGRSANAGEDLVGFSVTSRHFLDESSTGATCPAEGPAGSWSVEVRDLAELDTGTVDLLSLTLFGTEGTPANRAPTADAGPDQTVTAGDTVTLDGSGSSDPDGDPLTYQWTQVRGTPIALDDEAAAMPSFTAPAVSSTTTYAWDLVVEDGHPAETASSPDRFRLRIEPGAGGNQAPVADAGARQSAPAATLVQLDATGSSDPDGDSWTCQWLQRRGTPVTLDDDHSCTPSFTAPAFMGSDDDRLIFALRVTDEHGARDQDRTRVTVTSSV